MPVTSASDPRIAPYRAVRDRDLARGAALFLAEGDVVLRVLLRRSRFRVHSVLLAENRVAGLASALADLPPETPVYVAAQAVMDAIAGFPIHRGVLAAAHRSEVDLAAVLGPSGPRTVVALLGVANHDNVGSIFRNAAAFGATGVILDRTSCDPLYRKAIRVSVGAALFVPFAWCDGPRDLLEALTSAGYSVVALTPASGATDIATLPRGGRVALLVGSEGSGLPPEVLDAATRCVTIPMDAGFDSLNVATATGIALYQLRAPPTAIVSDRSEP